MKPAAPVLKVATICFLSVACARACQWGLIKGEPPAWDLNNCPDWVLTDSKEITRDRLTVKGWVVFGKIVSNNTSPYSYTSMYITPVDRYDPVKVPNTTGDEYDPTSQIRNVLVSDDGRWILYRHASEGIFLIRPDGSGKTKVPIDADPANDGLAWYRSSPKGTEIALLDASERKVYALQVDLTKAPPAFGPKRFLTAIISTYGTKNHQREFCLARDIVYHRDGGGNGIAWRIPAGGNGTVGSREEAPEVYYSGKECGVAITHDGALLAHNYGTVVPFEYIPRTHKGFTVNPFFDFGKISPDDPSIRSKTRVVWCPEEYRTYYADNDEQFHHHHFSNDNNYLINIHNGSKVTKLGAYMVNWPKNEWCMVVPGDVNVNYAALYITTPTAARSPSRLEHAGVVQREAGSCGQAYTILGRRLRAAGQPGLSVVLATRGARIVPTLRDR